MAAPTGAVYGAGTADEGERLKGAGLGAKYSAIAGAAGPIAGVAGSSLLKGTKSAIKGAFAKNSDDISQVVSGIKDTSSKYYKAMRDAGAQIKAPKVQEIISNIDSSLAERGKLNSELHRKTLSVLEDFKEASKAGRMDLEELDQFRKLLTRIKPTPESKEDAGMARAAVRAIDDVVAGLKPNSLTKGGAKAVSALNNARKDWAKASKLEEVGYLIQKADGDPNKIKSLFKNFVDKNDKNGWRGFTKEEIKAVREAASGTTAEKLMKMGGKFGIDLGTSTTVGNTILPAVSGVGVSPVVPVIGTVSRQLQKYMARGKAEEVIRVLQQGGMPKEIGKLPPKVAIQIIQSINNKKSIPLAQSTAPTADIMRGQ